MALSNPPVYLLLGLGQLGLPILRHLSAQPSAPVITVLLRPNSSAAAEATAHGATVLSLDIASASEEELAEAFERFHTIVGCTGMQLPAGTQLRLAKAALAAKVPRYVPWQFGVDYDAIAGGSAQGLFAEQLQVRKLLRAQQKTEWVIVSVGMFMEFLFWAGFGVVDMNLPAVQCLGSWDAQVTVTSVDDIGRITALVLTQTGDGRVSNDVVWVAGDTVSYARIAEIVEGVSGKKVQHLNGSMEFLQHELSQDPGNGLKKYKAAFAEAIGVSWSKERTWHAKNGVPVLSLESWARQQIFD